MTDQITIPKADPDGVVKKLRHYSRSDITIHPNEWAEMGWGSKRNGRVQMITAPGMDISRVLKDLHGSLNIVANGYIVVGAHRVKSPTQDQLAYENRDYVYRIKMEPLAQFIVYAQHGYFAVNTGKLVSGKAPSKA